MGTRYATLAASTVGNVSVSHGDPVVDVIADAPDRTIYPTMETLEVLNVTGSGIVYFTYAFGAGTEAAASAGILPATPTIAGVDTIAIPAVAGAFVHIDAPDERNIAVVRAISAGTPQIAVSTVSTDRGVSDDGTGGGWKDFAEAVVTGGNGTVPTGGAAAVSNLASLVLDAAVDDLIEVAFNSINFGPQTFFTVRLLGGATPRSKGYPGWYYTSSVGPQGGWTFAPFKFLVVADDISAGTITLQLQGDAQGGTGTVLEGSVFQATNYGQPA